MMRNKMIIFVLGLFLIFSVPGCDFKTLPGESGGLFDYGVYIDVQTDSSYIFSNCGYSRNFRTILSFDTSDIPEENVINEAAIFVKIMVNGHIPSQEEIDFLKSNLYVDLSPQYGFSGSPDLEEDDFDAPAECFPAGRSCIPATFQASEIVTGGSEDGARVIAIPFPEREPGEVFNPMDAIHKGGSDPNSRTQVRLYIPHCVIGAQDYYEVVDTEGQLGVDAY
jgi:hypothetical protein